MYRFLAYGFACALLACGIAASDEPKVLFAKAPYYPEVPFLGNVSGEVHIEVELNEEGMVQKILSVEGPGALQLESKKAALQWKFNAGPAERTVRITFVFRTLPADADYWDEGFGFYPPASVEIVRILPVPIKQYGSGNTESR